MGDVGDLRHHFRLADHRGFFGRNALLLEEFDQRFEILGIGPDFGDAVLDGEIVRTGVKHDFHELVLVGQSPEIVK